jgi:hypothetical protein
LPQKKLQFRRFVLIPGKLDGKRRLVLLESHDFLLLAEPGQLRFECQGNSISMTRGIIEEVHFLLGVDGFPSPFLQIEG